MKTSFSKIAIMAAGLTVAAAASADYIFAFIGDKEGNGVLDYTGYVVTFDYATFSLVKSSSPADYLTVNGTANAVFSDDTGSRTATSFAVGDDSTTFNTFVVELWLQDGSNVGWQEYKYGQIANYIITEKGGASSDPLYITQVIPEPSSALLLLFGLAGLAIRRRKVVVSMLAVAFVGATFAAQNDLLISFSTKGPDTYADGTTVMDNECYALVWTPNGVEGTIAADGSASDGAEIVLVAPIARSGHCPNVVYRVDAGRVETEFRQGTGSWSVYLLDTRKYSYDKEGNQVVSLAGLKSDGKVKLVNASNKVGEASVRAGVGANTSLAAAVATSAETAAALPEDVPEPKVVGIEIKGGNVFVSVANAAPYLTYDLSTGDTPDAVTESVQKPCTGGDDGKVILVAPAKEGGAFFRVNRK